MCIPPNQRTLKKPISVMIYTIFEKNGICDYAKKDEFLSFLCSMDEFYKDAQNKDDRFWQFVDRLNEFCEAFQFERLRQIAYGELLSLMVANGDLKGIDYADRPRVVYHQALFHLGMLGFDNKHLNA